jgi:hypothetical protein
VTVRCAAGHMLENPSILRYSSCQTQPVRWASGRQ